jgi:hypothetical protein
VKSGQVFVRFWNLPVTLIGLWVGESRQVEVVSG